LSPVELDVGPPHPIGDQEILRFHPEAGHAGKIDGVGHLIARMDAEKQRRALKKKLSKRPA
jgi:hypothetical protein